MWTKESLFSNNVFVGSDKWSKEEFDRSGNELKALMVAGLISLKSPSIINAWIDRGKIAIEFRRIVHRIVAEGLVECPWRADLDTFPVSSSVRSGARDWVRLKYILAGPGCWISNDTLNCGRILSPELLNGIFYAMPEWVKAMLWLTTLPQDPSITIAAAKAVSPDRAESARESFIRAAQMNCIKHPVNNNTIHLKIDSLIALRKWYCCQPESIVKLGDSALLRGSPGSPGYPRDSSSLRLSLFKGDEVRIVSGPHGSDCGRSWFRCIVKKTAGFASVGSSGFLLIDHKDISHDVGLECSDSLMDGAIISNPEYEEENKLSSANWSEEQISQLLEIQESLRKSSTGTAVVPEKSDLTIQQIRDLEKARLQLSTYGGTGGTISSYSTGTVNELDLAVEALREEIELKNASIKKLTEELEAAKSGLNSANTNLDTEKSARLEISRRLEDLDKKFRDDVKCTESIIREKQQKIDDLHKTMLEDRRSYAADVEAYDDRLSGKQDLIDDVYKKLTEVTDRNEELSNKLVKLSESLDYELGRTSELEALLEEKNKSSETMSSAISALRNQLDISEHRYDAVKSEISEASYRVAASQFVKMVRDPLAALIVRHIGHEDDSARNKIGSFLRTDIGYAFVSSVLSVVVGHFGDTEMTRSLSRELRVGAMAEISDSIADLIAEPLRKVISELILDDKKDDEVTIFLPESKSTINFDKSNDPASIENVEA